MKPVKGVVYCGCVLLLTLFSPARVLALGGYLTNGYSQIAPTEVKALVSWDGTEETIIASQTFVFNPLVAWDFIWLTALPARPSVEFISDEPFVKLEKLTESDQSPAWQKWLFWDIGREKAVPEESFTRPIDLIQYKIFGPGEGEKFGDWLREGGYLVPKSARDIIAGYERAGWYLVAMEVNGLHIEYEAKDSLSVHAAHTLPVKIRFAAQKPFYPLKFISIQPDTDSAAVPFSYGYGVESGQALGESDSRADQLLATPSGNKYPTLPLDLANLKAEIYFLGRERIALPGFLTAYAGPVSAPSVTLRDLSGKEYFRPPGSPMLTRLYIYEPLLRASDLWPIRSADQSRVNARPEQGEVAGRGAAAAIALVIGVKLLWRKRRGV